MRSKVGYAAGSTHLPLIVLWMAGFGLAGCASSQGPEVLTINAAQYAAAFDAASEAARSAGMVLALRDRRSGLIETEPQFSGSLLEPWRTDNASFQQARENTLSFQRRRARFEFMPVGFQPPASSQHADAQSIQNQAASRPDIVGVQPWIDLTQHQGELELRVLVFVERSNTPGIRRSTWTRSQTSNTLLVAPEGQTGSTPATYWIPTTRDLACERRLLAAVESALGQPRADLQAISGQAGANILSSRDQCTAGEP